MTKPLALTVLLVVCVAMTAHAEMKVPRGCVAAAGAKATANGYADRVTHENTDIKLVLINAGSFTMGEMRINTDAQPPHKVTIANAFYIGRTEVTNAQYRKFIDATDYDGEADTDPAYDLYLRHWRGESLMSAEDDYPVCWISWKNAKAFCAWAGLALPSEAQWEYACRAGTTTFYYNGDDEKSFGEIGWALLPSSEALTHPVAQREPNAWGLYDMLGNVWEWCEDDYAYKYHGAPTDGSARIGSPQRLLTRSLRGGSWSNSTRATTCSSAARFNSAPGNAANDMGFRVVLVLP